MIISNICKDELSYIKVRENYSERELEIIQFLIESGASINACDDEGDTPLDYAKRFHPSAADIILGFHLRMKFDE